VGVGWRPAAALGGGGVDILASPGARSWPYVVAGLGGQELVMVLLGVLLKMLVLVGDRLLLPVFMGKGLQLVVLRLMLVPRL
jgi:hypothetical protein